MKHNIVASAILGGALILSAAIVAGGIPVKDENVLQVVDGSVKLGNVFSEDDLVSAKLVFSDDNQNQVLFENIGPAEAESRLQERIKEFSEQVNYSQKDEAKKIAPERLSIKVPATLVLTAAVKYRSEYQPSFTLTLTKEEVNLPANSNMLETIKPAVSGFIEKQKNKFDSSHFLK
ncbi:hypothetical protein [Cronobacter sakazakii]|uniref:hypothetical protein n=1 Tax=Cronobacter sakazakii TaxID=28141 RepID=UPI002893E5B5|nr:hypothetical protein [Cronobacter sakazakii]MDT3545615.1 hypothetical protein [Cronobacter sakazakii]